VTVRSVATGVIAVLTATGYTFRLVLKWLRILLRQILDAIRVATEPRSAPIRLLNGRSDYFDWELTRDFPDDSSQPPKTLAQSSIDQQRGRSFRFGGLGWATRRIRATSRCIRVRDNGHSAKAERPALAGAYGGHDRSQRPGTPNVREGWRIRQPGVAAAVRAIDPGEGGACVSRRQESR